MPRRKKTEATEETTHGALADRIKEQYFTAQEAYQYLGLTRDAFNNYVKRDPKAYGQERLLGKHGYYRREKIEEMKSRLELLFAPEPGDFVFRTPRMDKLKNMEQDMEQEDRMAYLNFGPGSFTDERKAARRLYLKANPQSTFHLYKDDILVAFINLIPLSHDAILEFQKGIRGWTFPVNKIKQFRSGERLECIIIDMATATNVRPAYRYLYASQIMHHMSLQFAEWGRQGVDIRSIDACGGTEDGKKLLIRVGFSHTGTYHIPAITKPEVLVDRDVYHLDVDSSDRSLFRQYKREITNWKNLQGEKENSI